MKLKSGRNHYSLRVTIIFRLWVENSTCWARLLSQTMSLSQDLSPKAAWSQSHRELKGTQKPIFFMPWSQAANQAGLPHRQAKLRLPALKTNKKWERSMCQNRWIFNIPQIKLKHHPKKNSIWPGYMYLIPGVCCSWMSLVSQPSRTQESGSRLWWSLEILKSLRCRPYLSVTFMRLGILSVLSILHER